MLSRAHKRIRAGAPVQVRMINAKPTRVVYNRVVSSHLPTHIIMYNVRNNETIDESTGNAGNERPLAYTGKVTLRIILNIFVKLLGVCRNIKKKKNTCR